MSGGRVFKILTALPLRLLPVFVLKLSAVPDSVACCPASFDAALFICRLFPVKPMFNALYSFSFFLFHGMGFLYFILILFISF